MVCLKQRGGESIQQTEAEAGVLRRNCLRAAVSLFAGAMAIGSPGYYKPPMARGRGWDSRAGLFLREIWRLLLGTLRGDHVLLLRHRGFFSGIMSRNAFLPIIGQVVGLKSVKRLCREQVCSHGGRLPI